MEGLIDWGGLMQEPGEFEQGLTTKKKKKIYRKEAKTENNR